MVPADQRWWENKPVSGPRPAAAVVPSRVWPQTPPPGSSLPAPPPLSAPLSTSGTGPMPQLSQQMVPPSETIWWRLPQAGQDQGPVGPGYPGYHGSAPPAPVPRGYAPHAPVPAPPGPPAPRASAPVARAVDGAGHRRLAPPSASCCWLLGAGGNVPIVVVGGLVAGAWGMWRLVTATGKGGKPPGQT